MDTKYNRNGGLTLVPLPKFTDLAQSVVSRIAAKHPDTPVDIVTPEFGFRVNGEPLIKLGKEHIGGHDCVVLTSGPGTPEMLLQLWLTLAYLVGRRAARIMVATGYFPLGRSDKDEGSLEFALATFITHLTLSAGYDQVDRILAADLHAPQVVMATRCLGKITEVSLARRLLDKVVRDVRKLAPKRPICLLLPDDGAYKKFTRTIEQVSKDLGIDLPVVCGQKRRQSSRSSKILGLSGDTDALEHAYVIGFDDEITTGKTLLETAEMVKGDYKAHAFWAAAIHGVLCGNAPQVFSASRCPVNRVYITDTIPPYKRAELKPLRKVKRLHIVSCWASDLAELVFHHHWDESIRELR